MKKEKENLLNVLNPLHICIWFKTKKILYDLEITNRENKTFKEKIGYKLINDNKLYCKEFFFWCDIFNEYKQKLPLFYNYAKSYKIIFTEINQLLHEIQTQIKMENETFMQKISHCIFKYTTNSGYKEICKHIFMIQLVEILNSEMFNSEYSFEKVEFCSNLPDIDINERNVHNSEFIVNLIASENAHFEKEINKIKVILDSMTDICENSAILDINILNSLKEYLVSHQHFIGKNIND